MPKHNRTHYLYVLTICTTYLRHKFSNKLFSDYFLAPMPAKYRKLKVKPRGVSNRNRGLQWIRANATEGVLYFADDDNTYNLQIFEQVTFY